MQLIIFTKKFTSIVFVFVLSLVFFDYYTGGDQEVYRAVYENLSDMDLFDAFIYYRTKTNSEELVHFFLSWLVGSYVDQNIFVAISNSVLAYAALSLFQKWGASFYVALIIILTNYYLLVLYFPAERLKFGFILLSFSLININSKKFYIFFVLAVVAHVQIIILYASIFATYLTKIFQGRIHSRLIFFLPLFIGIPLYLMSDQISRKFFDYSGGEMEGHQLGLVGTWKLIVFFLLSIYYSKDKVETISFFAPLFFAVFLIGGERINQFGYFLFLYYGLRFKGGRNYGVAVTSAYYAYASLVFIAKIIQHGHGF